MYVAAGPRCAVYCNFHLYLLLLCFMLANPSLKSLVLPSISSALSRFHPYLTSPYKRLTTLPMSEPKSIPTFEDMRVRLQPVWEKEENRNMIAWAGIFGSIGRGRAHKDSDVDVLLVMKEGTTGEPIELEYGQRDSAFSCDMLILYCTALFRTTPTAHCLCSWVCKI